MGCVTLYQADGYEVRVNVWPEFFLFYTLQPVRVGVLSSASVDGHDVMDPKIWTEKRPFLRWCAALKMENSRAPNPQETPAEPEGQGRRRGH
jgi:hypothetical protein